MTQNSQVTKAPFLPIRVRKAIGTLVLLVGLFAYTLIAVAIAVSILPENGFVEFLYYATAGIAWAFPARYLLVWMQRPDAEPG